MTANSLQLPCTVFIRQKKCNICFIIESDSDVEMCMERHSLTRIQGYINNKVYLNTRVFVLFGGFVAACWCYVLCGIILLLLDHVLSQPDWANIS